MLDMSHPLQNSLQRPGSQLAPVASLQAAGWSSAPTFLSPTYFVTHEFSAKFRWGSTNGSKASVFTGRFRADYTIVRSGADATREVTTQARIQDSEGEVSYRNLG